jgi:hypothetical protein
VVKENGPLWTELKRDAFPGLDTVKVKYRNYRLFALDSVMMQTILMKAPKGAPEKVSSPKTIVEIPVPDGGFARFNMYTTSTMDPALEAKFPTLKTYGGQGMDDPSSTIRLDFNQNGFHAYVKSQKGEWFVEPAGQGVTHRFLICFYKEDAVFPDKKPFELPDPKRR